MENLFFLHKFIVFIASFTSFFVFCFIFWGMTAVLCINAPTLNKRFDEADRNFRAGPHCEWHPLPVPVVELVDLHQTALSRCYCTESIFFCSSMKCILVSMGPLCTAMLLHLTPPHRVERSAKCTLKLDF